MKILVLSSGNIVQLAKYPRYFAYQGHEVVFVNPEWSNALCDRTEEDEFGGTGIRFYTWNDFIAQEIYNEKFDCIFGTQHGASIKVLQMQHAIKVPALLQVLDIVQGSEKIDKDLTNTMVHQQPYLRTYKSIKYLTAINPATQKQLNNFTGHDDVRCIFYPIDMALFDSVPDQETEDFVLIVSRASSYKRIDLAKKACEYAGKKLVWVGGPNAVTDNEKAMLMKQCKMHIFTQMWAEGPCIPSAEALYCKKPSIIFDYPAQRAIEGNYSYYVEPGDWKAMGEQIKWVDANYKEATKFASSGHEWVKNNLAPDIIAQQILDVLIKITGEK